MSRIPKEIYYLNISYEVAQRSTCLRRKYGALIVKEDQIISTGYCGSPRGTTNCSDIGICLRNELNIAEGLNYELCRGVHAEQNAIISPSRLDMINSTLYLVGIHVHSKKILNNPEPCQLCKRIIINAGVKTVITFNESRNDYSIIDVNEFWVKKNTEAYTYEKGHWIQNPLYKGNKYDIKK